LDPNSERAQLNKYTHFLNRYNIHQQSINLEEKLHALADKVMQELLDKVRWEWWDWWWRHTK
jgi:hypothetical protein